jgi:cytochrome c553
MRLLTAHTSRIAALATLAFGVSLGVASLTRAQMPAAPKQPPAQRALHGQHLVDSACAACHGVDGNGTGDHQFPKLAGQDRAYLLTQLEAFKSGARKSDVMAPVVADLSRAQLAELARFFSRQRIAPDTVRDRDLAARGARIFNSPSRNAPSCAACHANGGYGPMMGGGMMGRGMMMGGGRGPMGMMGASADVPNLFGQRAEYTVQQLDAFAAGQRRGTVMGPIAAGLSERQRSAVAQYLSGLK